MCRKYLVIAGDGRQREIVQLLKARGESVEYIKKNMDDSELASIICQCDTVILPLPVSKNAKTLFSDDDSLQISVDSVFSALNSNHAVIAGGFDCCMRQMLKEKNIAFIDCLKDEGFSIYNAFLTAQGALQLMLENCDDYLPSKRVLITGYGRVGKACAAMLKSLGCDVYVAARRMAQRTEAETANCKTLSTDEIGANVFLFDFVLNTVPSRLFDEKATGLFKRGSVYIELASSPFGADKAAFENSRACYVNGSSLPGRLCRMASAKAILRETDSFL